MNSVPAQEIKRRAISAVDEALRRGAVHVIKNNRPQYVVLTEERFADLMQTQRSRPDISRPGQGQAPTRAFGA